MPDVVRGDLEVVDARIIIGERPAVARAIERLELAQADAAEKLWAAARVFAALPCGPCTALAGQPRVANVDLGVPGTAGLVFMGELVQVRCCKISILSAPGS